MRSGPWHGQGIGTNTKDWICRIDVPLPQPDGEATKRMRSPVEILGFPLWSQRGDAGEAPTWGGPGMGCSWARMPSWEIEKTENR